MTTHTAIIDTPIGFLGLQSDDGYLTLVEFNVEGPELEPTDQVLRTTADQLREYFAGERTEFDLPLQPNGTKFQRQVWTALTEIPYAETWSYGELARHIGQPNAFRAVGAANGQNPLPIIVPCHRVVGSNGKLTGFGGGLPTKQYLLELEAKTQLELDFTS